MIRGSRGRARWIAGAVLAGVAIAACGATGTPSATVTNGSSAPNPDFLKFAKCMRANGVPNMPDTGNIPVGSGVDPSTPAFQRAVQTCKRLLPGGGPPGHATEQQKQHMVATAECMRGHGVSGFPDPITATHPPSNPQDYSIAQRAGDLWLLVPSTIDVSSPAFKQAASACGF